MGKSRLRNGLYTAFSGTAKTIISFITTFVSRSIFIYLLSAEYLSLNGLFSNILSLLSLAELGMGSAITFYLYEPIADNDRERIKTILRFYKFCYRTVGLFIICAGACLMPLLPRLVNFDSELPVNLYVVYFLFLLNNGCTYLLNAYKESFIRANQAGYKVENISSVFLLLNCLTDAIVLIMFRNYIVYLVGKLLLTLGRNVTIGIVADKMYPFIKEKGEKLPKEEYKLFFKDVGNILIFNMGDRMLNAVDNIIMSIYLGTLTVGFYSNYNLILTQIKSFYNQVFNSFRAGIGDVIASESEKKYEVYKQINLVNQILSTCVTVGLFQIINSFINIWIGGVDKNYILPQSVIFAIVLNKYFDIYTIVLYMFKEAQGEFKVARYASFLSGFLNIVLSIIFVKRIGLFGIFLATVICKYTVSSIPFVIGVADKVFDGRRKEILIDFYGNLILTCVLMAGSWFICRFVHCKSIFHLVAEFIICSAYLVCAMLLIHSRKKEFKAVTSKFFTPIKAKIFGRR